MQQVENNAPTNSRFKEWLLQGVVEREGPHEKEGQHQPHPWWQVMCLTGVDYFSTLGYQPGIAFLAAGALSPIATLVLILLTLFGALPMYNRVAAASPHGDGSISMLENLLTHWKGKLFVLALLGFAATSFIITITLSAADATAHIVENPFVREHLHFLDHPILVTLVLIGLLGAVFLKGFKEAVGIAVAIVVIYIGLNIVVLGAALLKIAGQPELLSNWQTALLAAPSARGSWLFAIFASLFLFPKLALGLSGFETGVVVMPLVKGDPGDTEEKPLGRIRNTRKLLMSAALIMSVLLLASSISTTFLIPPAAFEPATADHPAGDASGRALAFLAHSLLGDVFGTLYDVSTILILWFAGSSAMAGLLNIVPRYLPRYGMAPDWARATRPLVLVFTAICFVVTVLFEASVEAQGGAYATGVLALMTSAAVAVTLLVKREKSRLWLAFLLITLIFVYTTVVNIVEQPSGLRIAVIFIIGIVVVSFVSRALRTTELRVNSIEFDAAALAIVEELKQNDEIRLVAHKAKKRDRSGSSAFEYTVKAAHTRRENDLESEDDFAFFEVKLIDPSEFSNKMIVTGTIVEGHKILRAEGTAIPNAIAAFLIHLRNKTGKIPNVYFTWSEGNPAIYILRYLFLGEGDTAPVTREILRQVEPDRERRPRVHVG